MTTRPHNLTADQARAMQDRRLTALIVPLKVQPTREQTWHRYQTAKLDWQIRDQNGLVVDPGVLPFQPGDMLWMRETWRSAGCTGHSSLYGEMDADWEEYKADCPGDARKGWRSPITMPRSASRMTAIVGPVSVIRVQDVTEEQARALGCERPILPHWPSKPYLSALRGQWVDRPLKPPRDWDSNPWCALADLDVHLCNVDQVKETVG